MAYDELDSEIIQVWSTQNYISIYLSYAQYVCCQKEKSTSKWMKNNLDDMQAITIEMLISF